MSEPVNVSEIAAFYPALTLLAEHSARQDVDPEVAEWLDGRLFVQWLEANTDLKFYVQFDTNLARRVREWRAREKVSVEAADKTLVKFGYTFAHLPDALWTTPPFRGDRPETSPAEKAQAVERVRQGDAASVVAKEFGVSAHSVRNWVREARS